MKVFIQSGAASVCVVHQFIMKQKMIINISLNLTHERFGDWREAARLTELSLSQTSLFPLLSMII